MTSPCAGPTRLDVEGSGGLGLERRRHIDCWHGLAVAREPRVGGRLDDTDNPDVCRGFVRHTAWRNAHNLSERLAAEKDGELPVDDRNLGRRRGLVVS